MIDMKRWEDLAEANVGKRPGRPGRLRGKLAVVTGSAQGFGRGIAEALHREGATVAIADLNLPLAETAAGEIGEGAFPVKVDVSDEESVARMVQLSVERMGGIDLFVSNAGVLKSGGLDVLEKKDFEFVTSINYTAYFTGVKYVSAIMRAERRGDPGWTGDIVEVNSKSGIVGSNRNFAYAGSKFGGIGLTQSFALELCPYGIKVNAVCPGNFLDGPLWTDPERGLFVQYLKAGKVPGARSVQDVKAYYESKVPMGRGCYPEDVAKAIFYCVEQSYETGQAIPVSGGQVMLHA